jgi:ankyrin repeat protein
MGIFDLFSNPQEKLNKAIQAGDLDTVQRLASKPEILERRGKNGITPLGLAVKEGKAEIVRFLLSRNVDLNGQNNNGETPLFIVVKGKNHDLAELLLDAMCDPNIPDNQGVTPLMLASELGDVSIVAKLCDRGAKVDVRDRNGKTALLHVTSHVDLQRPIIDLLVERGAQPDITLLEKLIDDYRMACGLLLQTSADDRNVWLQVLRGIYQLRDLIAWAITKASDFNASNGGGLVSTLLGKGTMDLIAPTFNYPDHDVHIIEFDKQMTSMIDILLSHGIDIDNRGYMRQSAICCAARNMTMGVLKHLIAKGAIVDHCAVEESEKYDQTIKQLGLAKQGYFGPSGQSRKTALLKMHER